MEKQNKGRVACDWAVDGSSTAKEKQDERRIEQRLRYHWPVWFAEDFDDALLQGQMVDVSSGGAAFTYYPQDSSLHADQYITTKFSVPSFGEAESFEMASFVRKAHVCRVENVNDYLRKVAVRFSDPLPFKPGEQAETEIETEQKLKSVTI